MKDLTSMTEQELRATRGDMYQERENAQAAAQSASQNIMAINQELATREDKEPEGSEDQ